MKCKICGLQTVKKCSQCRVVCYCDSKCQLQDWVTHKSECNAFKKYILDWLEMLKPEEKTTKVCIISSTDKETRKLIHQCIERATTTFSRSITHPDLPVSRVRCFKKCYECGFKHIHFGTEHYYKGMMANNQDEYYYIKCPRCFHGWHWECNYDGYDSIVCYNGNNCVIVGDAMQHFKRTKVHKLKDESCPRLPPVSSYDSITYNDIPSSIRSIKNLIEALTQL